MTARLKVDENLPGQLAELLVELGYDAVTVSDQGWRGISDRALWRGAQAEGRWTGAIVVVTDRGIRVRRTP